VIGEVTVERLDVLRKADVIILDELKKEVGTTRSGRRSACCCR